MVKVTRELAEQLLFSNVCPVCGGDTDIKHEELAYDHTYVCSCPHCLVKIQIETEEKITEARVIGGIGL